MNAIRARLAAGAASFLLATLASWGVAEATPELAAQVEAWVDRTFELILLLGYATLHPWLQKRGDPAQAATTGAAQPPHPAAHLPGDR
jgi:hypothetical protein